MPRSVLSGCRGWPTRPGLGHVDRIRSPHLVAVSLIVTALISPIAASASGPTSTSASVSGATSASTEKYVVEFTSARGRRQTAADESLRGTAVGPEWADAIDGFAADLSPSDVQRLRNDPDVLRVERDQPVAAATTQTTPPWGLDRIDQRSRPLSNTYSYTTTGAGVTAYVIDTGIRSTHQQFGGRVGSGYVYSGVDTGVGAEDCNGHGTHVAGTIGGTTYGVAKAVTLIPVRVLDCSGNGSTTGVIAGINWVIAHHEAGAPAVANLSLGGSNFQPEDDAINNLIADGITVVVAAGNAQSPAPPTDACLDSPARVPAAITVGAITNSSNDAVASYSNFGSCLDLFAPGSGVLSADSTSDIATQVMSGTSMATPHVAGVVARMLQSSPLATPAQIWAEIDASATLGVVTGTTVGDPNKLLYMSSSGLPSAPLSVSATPANARVALTW
ncbi:MAG: S8 family serine peptidase, partial [Actinobacteria bacterium]|nr:S8 family serine peptidase [Actinomycetota bacterium]